MVNIHIVRVMVVGATCLLLGFVVGRFSSERSHDKDVRSLVLADAALRASQCASVLTAMREGHVAPAQDRLEMHLDLALVDILRHYSPAIDERHGAARSIRHAREYRAK